MELLSVPQKKHAMAGVEGLFAVSDTLPRPLG
jgi:hypothetical protein